jgi:hypothetical protein
MAADGLPRTITAAAVARILLRSNKFTLSFFAALSAVVCTGAEQRPECAPDRVAPK